MLLSVLSLKGRGNSVLEKFKYQMTLESGSAQTVKSAVTWGWKLAKSSYNFYSGWKSL